MKPFFYYVYMLIWDVFVWGGACYLIVAHGWSKWFLVLALAITMTSSTPSVAKKP